MFFPVVNSENKDIASKIRDGQKKFKEEKAKAPTVVYINKKEYEQLGQYTRNSFGLKVRTIEYVPDDQLWFSDCASYAY